VAEASPDVVVIAGDATDEGDPDQYAMAKAKLESLACETVVLVGGNHDAKHVGHLYSVGNGFSEETFGARDRHVRLQLAGRETALVALEIGRERYGWIEDRFAAELAMLLVHSGAASAPCTRAFPRPVHNLIDVDVESVSVRLGSPAARSDLSAGTQGAGRPGSTASADR
jgi:calcineurin-like phosphoesterase family protein